MAQSVLFQNLHFKVISFLFKLVESTILVEIKENSFICENINNIKEFIADVYVLKDSYIFSECKLFKKIF